MLFETTRISKKTGAFALLDSLIRNGTKYIFGYPGGAILPIYDELYLWERQNLIKHILSSSYTYVTKQATRDYLYYNY